MALFVIVSIAGCAGPASSNNVNDTKKSFWSGRLALQIASEPPESLSGTFELGGDARNGSLHLFSPLGSTLAVLRWTPQSASLLANNQTQTFDSLDALARQVTGTPLPLAALFEWLAGQPVSAAGWRADLSRLADGRLLAERAADASAPAAQLRIALDSQ
ncbi:MAG: outer membrane lipoprotein LolB [Burkholderiales bacterium]